MLTKKDRPHLYIGPQSLKYPTNKYYSFHLPTSRAVLTVLMSVLGPSPTAVKANTWTSYSVYLRSPVILFLKVVPPWTTTVFSDSAEPFLLKNSLNPIMIPFLESVGGSCQEAKIPRVEVSEATVKLTGARDGTVKKSFCVYLADASVLSLDLNEFFIKKSGQIICIFAVMDIFLL